MPSVLYYILERFNFQVLSIHTLASVTKSNPKIISYGAKYVDVSWKVYNSISYHTSSVENQIV